MKKKKMVQSPHTTARMAPILPAKILRVGTAAVRCAYNTRVSTHDRQNEKSRVTGT